ncbi:hypothetical protein CIG19_05765 [Enterobacterales bacterium CwR94]|nr:hypothetical protein CIG19_05765 [Enterobacterales bacterium CwR94]
MKRTKNIHHAAFRKSWSARHLTPVALAISAVFMLAGCEQADETVSLYQNADDCSRATGQSEQCTASYNNALKEAEKTAPKYASREECVAEFGENQCQQTPAQAGVGTTTNAEANSGGGSFWMPLMAGYMMGRMMSGGGYQQQPLFSSKNPASPANGKFVDATGRNYGPATAGGRSVSVPKTALAPKPATTSTVTRGGFGESVAKQSAMQRSAATGTSSRSMGG